MIKVEIKPVYESAASLSQASGEIIVPSYLEKTVTFFGFIVFRKRVKPVVCPKGGYELFYRF